MFDQLCQRSKYLYSLFICCFIFHLPATETIQKPLILVSIAPYRTFVQAIAANSVDVQVIVPPGSSSHTFEPTPKQMIAASHADLWFRIGETFEDKFAKVILNYNPTMKFSNLRQGIEMIKIDHSHGHHCACQNNFEDIHFWLSPQEVKTQVQTITRTLSDLYPENKEQYTNNCTEYLNKIAALDLEIRSLLKNCSQKTLFVSHPAFTYFARDYGLFQLAVEREGKDPTPKQLTTLLAQVQEAGVKTILIQPQYSNKGAYLIARHLNVSIVSVDPYSEDFFGTMLFIAKTLHQDSSR